MKVEMWWCYRCKSNVRGMYNRATPLVCFPREEVMGGRKERMRGEQVQKERIKEDMGM